MFNPKKESYVQAEKNRHNAYLLLKILHQSFKKKKTKTCRQITFIPEKKDYVGIAIKSS